MNKDFKASTVDDHLNKLYELVHFADILGNTIEDEPDSVQLIQLQIECVLFEFAFESKLYGMKYPTTENSTVTDLYNSQINFLNNLVLKQIQESKIYKTLEEEKVNKKPPSGSMNSYIDEAYLNKLLKYLERNVNAFEEVKKTAEGPSVKLQKLFEDIDSPKVLSKNLYTKFFFMPIYFKNIVF